MGSSGLGVEYVSGRSRVPSPPTRTTAFTARESRDAGHGVVVAGAVVTGAVVAVPGVVVVEVCERHGELLLRIALLWSEIWSNAVHAAGGKGISAPLGSR